nr:HNH endonuclease [Deinococcus humi]
MACEACGFDFQAVYGERGKGIAEYQHIVPLSEARERKTRLDDLVVVWANCHRMIHRASSMWTVEEVIWISFVLWRNWDNADPSTPHPELVFPLLAPLGFSGVFNTF